MKKILTVMLLAACCCSLGAQTASSLFWRKDSLQVSEIKSKEAVQYNFVGHHGPAVENVASAFRIYFNDSGAIDVYSKSGKMMELAKYHWYPTEAQQKNEGAGCDEYMVGKTVGLGGIALWDGTQVVKLVATGGRTARVGKTSDGSYAEMIAYGVECGNEKYDVSIRVDVYDGSRIAKVTASELNGRKVRFVTGVNYHAGETVSVGKNYLWAWGVHPADVASDPQPLGAGMFFNRKDFSKKMKTDDMLMLISKPCSSLSTRIVAASTMEDELNDVEKFGNYMQEKH